MKISLRGERSAPILCFESRTRACTVKSALEWVLSKGKESHDPAILALEDSLWNPQNFLDRPHVWPSLLALDALVDAGNCWPSLQVVNSGVPYLPPILEPPLFLGLAGNCPMTWRPDSRVIPNYPVVYSRTPHTLSSHLDRVRLPEAVTSFRCAVELGVVIRRRARNVPKQEAMQYVAGFTIVNDMISNHWKDFAAGHNSNGTPSFEELLITSYYGRGTAGFAPFGPCIVDQHKIDNPYDLMMYSRINETLIDRSHTNAMVIGIDSAIEYFSRYFTLEPGSVIHMGTMGIDGITLAADKRLNLEDYVEMEIEHIGKLRVFFDDLRVSTQ